jgi:5-formyltetrahydrofolate cyclo-ligase
MSQSSEKALIRNQMREQRHTFLQKYGVIALNAFSSSSIFAVEENFEFPEGSVVGGYWPLQEEADCRPLMMHLIQKKIRCALPCVEDERPLLTFRSWNPNDRLIICPLFQQTLRLMQPLPETESLVPDYLLVPLLSFDRLGYRLGYGGGYYDRTLQMMRQQKNITAIGLGYSCQETALLPHEAHDELLNYVITEKGLRTIKT